MHQTASHHAESEEATLDLARPRTADARRERQLGLPVLQADLTPASWRAAKYYL
jgi:hypothetical protein